ncbi:predicted protein [Uncinocarpus reesii 1704]|uniref:ubiquitinyl hydrolase 1 n=1 Tax=Uncinocarpus reesii (strain UAMH 1704) TaxID=336963 RepID=C4JM15_UNCRE|nr:uncharacterized protein UREG_03873 [Uncinocarpus reesii 1704]EEP79027.1 predicted protein [Uncinocarpus reesii 1704]
MLRVWENVYSLGVLSSFQLVDALKKMEENDMICLDISAQNAGFFLKKKRIGVVVGCYEVSATNSAVMEAVALRRTFPSRVIALPLDLLQNDSFLSQFTIALRQLDSEKVDAAMAKTKRATAKVVEERDTANPFLVTELIMGVLSAHGFPTIFRSIEKRVRDDVCWHQSKLPWRRSPLWTTIRVSIQLYLNDAELPNGELEYKNFVLFLVLAIAASALDRYSSSDMLFVLNAKMAHRVAKLGRSNFDFLHARVAEMMARVRNYLEARWNWMQTYHAVRLNKLSLSNISRDTSLCLYNSRDYLREVRTLPPSHATMPDPPTPKRFSPPPDILPSSEFLCSLSSQDVHGLADFEAWVQHRLPVWLSKSKNWESKIGQIGELVALYNVKADAIYGSIAEHLSIKFLTIVELWCALDRLTCRKYPLLLEYPPDIPIDFLTPLLLPKRSDMRRLEDIEQYIQMRYEDAKWKMSAFFSPISSNSFAVRFYDEHRGPQRLRAKIEGEAAKAREQKRREWRQKMDRYLVCVKQENTLKHADSPGPKGEPLHIPHRCRKCVLLKEMKSLKIEKHEWPLPSDDVSLKAVVSELLCPSEISMWRDTTWMILQDLGRKHCQPSEKPVYSLTLANCKTFHNYLAVRKAARITLASNTKPFYVTHYRSSNFPVAVDDVFVKSSLSFRYFDSSKKLWVSAQKAPPSVHRDCITDLPPGPYLDSKLQEAVNATSHTPNQVISRLFDCSSELSADEFLAFGLLRSGIHLQWMNILRELGSGGIQLNSRAVDILICQAAWQVGPPLDQTDLRAAHNTFTDSAFCRCLLVVLESCYRQVESNWSELNAIRVIVHVLLRLLSLSSSKPIIARGLALLGRIRFTLFAWAKKLRNLDAETPNTEKRQITTAVALLIQETFNVEDNLINVVLEEPESLTIFVACAVILSEFSFECQQEDIDTRNESSCVDWLRYQKLCHSLEPKIILLARQRPLDVSNGIRIKWEKGSSVQSWKKHGSYCWIRGKSGGTNPQTVDFNCLSGELLIDGRPIQKLPETYTDHPLYKRVFGLQSFNTAVSDIPSLEYMTTGGVRRRLYFAMSQEDLIIRTFDGKDYFEVISPDKLSGDFPASLLDQFIHWRNLTTLEVTFCPLEALREPWLDCWKLSHSSGTSVLRRESRYLIERDSITFKCVAPIFEPLESPEYLEVTYCESGTLEVNIPRYQLRFFLNADGQFECSELLAIVDTDQTLGTLIGLKNKLVLRDTQGQRRRILIPYGNVRASLLADHVLVTVDTDGESQVRYFQYEADPYLRQLRGMGDLVSTLYKSYLHALTTFVLPDPFTGVTGTEECLTGLQQSCSVACETLDPKAISLLNLISKLTPRRVYYPIHLRCMEDVRWESDIPLWTQNDIYAALCDSLISYNNKFRDLYDSSEVIQLKSRGDTHLLVRSRMRNHYLERPEFLGGDLDKRILTAHYNSRDHGDVHYETACWVASLFKTWPDRFATPDLYKSVKAFDTIAFGTPFGIRSYTELLSLPLNSLWGSLFEICLRSAKKDSMYLTFLFAALMIGQPDKQKQWKTLIGCALLIDPMVLPAPPPGVFEPSHTRRKALKEVRARIRECVLPSADLAKNRQDLSQVPLEAQQDLVFHCIEETWESGDLRLPDEHLVPSINIPRLSARLVEPYESWHRTLAMRKYLLSVEIILNQKNGPDFVYVACGNINTSGNGWPASTPVHIRSRLYSRYSISDIFVRSQPKPNIEVPISPIQYRAQSILRTQPATEKLQEALTSLLLGNETRRLYGTKLLSSFENLWSSHERQKEIESIDKEGLFELLNLCLQNARSSFQALVEKLYASDFVGHCLQKADLYPRITPRSLLGQLSSSRSVAPSAWKEAIIGYGICLTRLQRVHRLFRYASVTDYVSFKREMDNSGIDAQLYRLHPDWLLMEIENNFHIRPGQATIAQQMIEPSSGSNSLLQFNMGEGKSSVVIPMVASSLANGNRLVRVVVLKPLAKQMLQILFSRFSGMLNRPIYHMPVSRKMEATPDRVNRLFSLFWDCRVTGGILLCQPEHILSLKLIGFDKLCSGELTLGKSLISGYGWLRQHARDILDESDEILSTNFELVYTVGTQQMVDGGALRWKLVQSVLDLLKRHAYTLHRSSPMSIEYQAGRKEAFPRIRILDDLAGRELISLVVADIMSGAQKEISFHRFSDADRSAVLEFITKINCDTDIQNRIQQLFGDTSHYPSLLLLRGLLAFKIIQLILQEKRWLVNYGLDLSRTLMAVPFRAKGVPSHSSEFAHPDVAIILTCLSYYYTGLTDAQVMEAFKFLKAESDPSLEYHRWQADTEMGDELRSLGAVNLKDLELCTRDLFPHLRYNKRVIDFFLSKTVFPKEAVEFPYKLSTSAWDIPDDTQMVTTGFSGTSDNSFLLPLSIKQEDLSEFKHINALVLQTLLLPENNLCLLAADSEGKALSAESLLALIAKQEPKIRVLIDVGAQVLELENHVVAQSWLALTPDACGAIFFNDNDELMVIDRAGTVESLILSRYRERPGECCVYLDEAHTRGTDLQLPSFYRAAVTLGPHLTKDRFAQACMRLRKLGNGQSFVCFAPPEIYRKIQSLAKKENDEILDTEDVLRWTLEESCQAIERLQPLYIQRGLNHSQRRLAQHEFLSNQPIDDAIYHTVSRKAFLDRIREREAKSLASMYLSKGIKDRQRPEFSEQEIEKDPVLSELVNISNNHIDQTVCVSRLYEAHERETVCEMEQQTEYQRPPLAPPMKHEMTPGLLEFVRSGSELRGPFIRAFESLAHLTLDDCFRKFGMDSELYVTRDFTQTVLMLAGAQNDLYLRPVHWILSSNIPKEKKLVIISPFEANKILAGKNIGNVKLHIFAPRITKSMRSFDDLDFYNIPSEPQRKVSPQELRLLRLFAGQLYLSSAEEYQELCQFLGVWSGLDTRPSHQDTKITVDGYVSPSSRAEMGWKNCPFVHNPLPYINALLGARRRGQDFSKSHMGQIVQGLLLQREDFIDLKE